MLYSQRTQRRNARLSIFKVTTISFNCKSLFDTLSQPFDEIYCPAVLILFLLTGGSQNIPADASNVEFWWHTHPKTEVGGVQLGSSTPSQADFFIPCCDGRNGSPI